MYFGITSVDITYNLTFTDGLRKGMNIMESDNMQQKRNCTPCAVRLHGNPKCCILAKEGMFILIYRISDCFRMIRSEIETVLIVVLIKKKRKKKRTAWDQRVSESNIFRLLKWLKLWTLSNKRSLCMPGESLGVWLDKEIQRLGP